EAEDLALLNRQGNVIHRHEAAEGLHHVPYLHGGLYRGHAFTAPSTARIVWMNAPSRFADPVSAFIASGVEQRISLPLCSSPTRLHRSASSRYAVVMKIVMPSFSSWYRMAQKSRRDTGSTP